MIKKHLKAAAVLLGGMLGMPGLHAQNTEALYIRSEKGVEAAAEKVIKEYAGEDKDRQLVYKELIQQAFDQYWKNPETGYPYTEADFRKKEDDIKAMSSRKLTMSLAIPPQKRVLNGLMSENRKIREGLDKSRQEQNADSTARAESFKQIIDTLSSANSQLLKERAEKDSLYRVLLGRKALLEACVKGLRDSLSAAGEVVQMLDSQKTRALGVCGTLESRLSAALASDSFSLLNLKAMDAAVKDFTDNESLIKLVASEELGPAHENADMLTRLGDLASGVSSAKSQMGSTFSQSGNARILQNLDVSGAGLDGHLSEGLSRELSDVTEALRTQEKCYAGICSLFEYLKKEKVGCLMSEDDFKELKIAEDAAFKSARESCRPYYLLMNKALDKIVSDLSPGSTLPVSSVDTEEKFAAYIDGIKKSL